LLSGLTEAFKAAHAAEVDAVEDHLELAGTQLDVDAVCWCFREVVAAGFQALAPQTQTVPAPVQDLEPVRRAIPEDEEVTGQRVGVQPRADQGEQAVERGIFLIPQAARTARRNRSSPSPSSIPVIPCMAAPSG
jgi:hypothetical protein